MTDPEARLAAALGAVEEILAEYGLRTYDRDGIHRWRCEYPDRYDGPCECFADMMQAIRDAVLAADPTLAADLALAAAVRESGLVDAAKALDRFMRQPDENEDGTPADWAPGLDAIGDFQNAVAIIKAAKEASEPDAPPAGAAGTATRQEAAVPLVAAPQPKPGGTP